MEYDELKITAWATQVGRQVWQRLDNSQLRSVAFDHIEQIADPLDPAVFVYWRVDMVDGSIGDDLALYCFELSDMGEDFEDIFFHMAFKSLISKFGPDYSCI